MSSQSGYFAEEPADAAAPHPLLQNEARLFLRTAFALRFYHAGQHIATQFSRLTIISRVAILSFAIFTTATVFVVLGSRGQAAPIVFDLPEAALRADVPYRLAACESLQDGHFRCTLEMDGNNVSLIYDGVRDKSFYSAKSIQALTLGNLIAAWGTPSGYAHYRRELVVIWGKRSAYFGPCSFQPTSHVEYLGYGLETSGQQTWRGFVSLAPECRTNQ